MIDIKNLFTRFWDWLFGSAVETELVIPRRPPPPVPEAIAVHYVDPIVPVKVSRPHQLDIPVPVITHPPRVTPVAPPPALPDAPAGDYIELVLQPAVSRRQLELDLYEQRCSPVVRSNLLKLFESATSLADLLYLRTKVVSQIEREILEQAIEANTPVDENEEPIMPDDFGRTCPPADGRLSMWNDDGPDVPRDSNSISPHEEFFAKFPNCKPPVR